MISRKKLKATKGDIDVSLFCCLDKIKNNEAVSELLTQILTKEEKEK